MDSGKTSWLIRQAWENPSGIPLGISQQAFHQAFSTRLSHRPWRLATPHGMGDHLWIDLMAWEITSWAHHKETRHAYWVSRAYGVTSWESRKDTPDSAEYGSTSWHGSIPLG